MSSTYSPNLRIELIGTGDQPGTWGDTTNTNLGSLIEQAIAGYTSIAMTDTDYTLSALNGSADQSRNATIEMTSIGSLSTTRNVLIPAAEKQYVFKNSTTGGQSLVVKVSGQTGVTVPNGKVVTVFCDGVNTYISNNYFPSLTLGAALPVASGGTGTTTSTGTGNVVLSASPTITSPTFTAPVLGTPASGTLTNCTGLPVATGISGLGTGVSTFLATPSSANLAAAVTDETGSGALVFATSPTLVTPVLGTPASGALTNCTGLPLTTGVTGTLPVANGGTGVTTSTGTGSVVLSNSPTLVTPALGTPASGTLTNCTGLPVSTGISGLGTGVATFLATPSSDNLRSAVTDETGTGALVFATSPTLVTPTLGTPASGTLTNCTGLPVSTGISGLGSGVATFLATPSSANLRSAVSDETGSGALVFATSPTLVTPVLGTPSSGTLTSCTGLPLTTGVTGTLPVANGGTGVTTLTGLAYGNGTSAFTAASAAQVVAAIGSTAVANATNAVNATTATSATSATTATTATTANALNTANTYTVATITATNGMFGVSPNSGTSGAITLKDAPGNPNSVYLQATSNNAITQYSWLKFDSSGPIYGPSNVGGDLGTNQTWHGVGRAFNTWYANPSSVRPMALSVYISYLASGNNEVWLYVGPSTGGAAPIWGEGGNNSTDTTDSLFSIIPPGWVYYLEIRSGSPNIVWWYELY